MTTTNQTQSECRHHNIRQCAEYKVYGCRLKIDGFCPDYQPKEKKEKGLKRKTSNSKPC